MKSILKSLYQNTRNQYIKGLIFNAFNKNWKMRVSVVLSQDAPISVLEYLSKDENQWIHAAIGAIKKTPSRLRDDTINNIINNPSWIKL